MYRYIVSAKGESSPKTYTKKRYEYELNLPQ